MRLQAKARLLTARFDLATEVGKMTERQQDTLAEGMDQIANWFRGNYMGRKGSGELVVSKTEDMKLMVNAMYWLSHNFAPKSLAFKTVYRIHDMKRESASRSGTVTVTPFKPILSWADTPNIDVDRSRSSKDAVIELQSPRVIFSYKTMALIESSLKHVDRKSQVYYSGRNLLDYADSFEGEREVVVYHGTKPFKARVLADLSDAILKEQAQALMKRLGFGPEKLNFDPDEGAFDLERALTKDEIARIRKILKAPSSEKRGGTGVWDIGNAHVEIWKSSFGTDIRLSFSIKA